MSLIASGGFLHPIVLVGGGFHHYNLIQALDEELNYDRDLILVAQQNKVLARHHVPAIAGNLVEKKQVELDLWKACQRKSVYFLEDRCLHINREESFLQLENFGKLPFEKLSIETQTLPQLQQPAIYKLSMANIDEFLNRFQTFVLEVRKHCPREVRVVLTGWRQESIELGMVIQQSLKGSCESCDVVIIDEDFAVKKSFFQSNSSSIEKRLKEWGIRVLRGHHIVGDKPQWLELSDGSQLGYDIMIPVQSWGAADFLGKILQGPEQQILVGRDLSDPRDSRIFITGENVFFEREKQRITEIHHNELTQVLLHNIFVAEPGDPFKTCRDTTLMDTLPLFTKNIFNWRKQTLENSLQSLKKRTMEEVKALHQIPLQEKPQAQLKESLNYQADHMSRPWKGLVNGSSQLGQDQSYKLYSFNGFDSWGSFAQSAIKICEMAILKCLSKGVNPKQLRFNLTLPDDRPHMTQHIFESTFNAIESVATQHNIQIDGGDTFNGRYWHLNVTMGGRIFRKPEERPMPHNYLLMTRPLGFGFLWAGRLKDSFDSAWVSRSTNEKMSMTFEEYSEFTNKWNPSLEVLIEEWGFLYHCLDQLPGHQQLMVNFREVPRWEGIDQLLKTTLDLPGLEPNWQRVKRDLAFKREDVSKANSVLWDSMSQGSLVLGVRPDQWQSALNDLQKMGYHQAALVGCIRPKTKGQRVVLSDWSPA